MLSNSTAAATLTSNGEPTGLFAHTPEPLAENLTDLWRRRPPRGGLCRFSPKILTPISLAIVDEAGRYVGEEYTLALQARYMFETHPGPGRRQPLHLAMIDDLAGQPADPAASTVPCRRGQRRRHHETARLRLCGRGKRWCDRPARRRGPRQP